MQTIDVSLQEWMRSHDFFPDQAMFVRDRIAPLFGAGLDHGARVALPRVVSTHVSKGHTLPVYSMARDDIGVRIVMRDNFSDWKLSVDSAAPVVCPMLAALALTSPPPDPGYTGDRLHPVYFEGFEPEWIFGYYSANRRKFSLSVGSDESLYAALFAILWSLGAIPDAAWAKRVPS